MEIRKHKQITYDLLGIDGDVVNLIFSICMNANQKQLNGFFESVGAVPNLIDNETWGKWNEFSQELKESIWRGA